MDSAARGMHCGLWRQGSIANENVQLYPGRKLGSPTATFRGVCATGPAPRAATEG